MLWVSSEQLQGLESCHQASTGFTQGVSRSGSRIQGWYVYDYARVFKLTLGSIVLNNNNNHFF